MADCEMDHGGSVPAEVMLINYADSSTISMCGQHWIEFVLELASQFAVVEPVVDPPGGTEDELSPDNAAGPVATSEDGRRGRRRPFPPSEEPSSEPEAAVEPGSGADERGGSDGLPVGPEFGSGELERAGYERTPDGEGGA